MYEERILHSLCQKKNVDDSNLIRLVATTVPHKKIMVNINQPEVSGESRIFVSTR